MPFEDICVHCMPNSRPRGDRRTKREVPKSAREKTFGLESRQQSDPHREGLVPEYSNVWKAQSAPEASPARFPISSRMLRNWWMPSKTFQSLAASTCETKVALSIFQIHHSSYPYRIPALLNFQEGQPSDVMPSSCYGVGAVACIQNFNCATLISPLSSKYLSSHSSGVLASDWSAFFWPLAFTLTRQEK